MDVPVIVVAVVTPSPIKVDTTALVDDDPAITTNAVLVHSSIDPVMMELADDDPTTAISTVEPSMIPTSTHDIANDDPVFIAHDVVDKATLVDDDPPNLADVNPFPAVFLDRRDWPYIGPLLTPSPSNTNIGPYLVRETTALLRIKGRTIQLKSWFCHGIKQHRSEKK